MITNKVTFAAIAAMAVALSLAVVPALTNQAFAAFPNEGKGHERECINGGDKDISKEDGGCPGQSEKGNNDENTYAGKSGNLKSTE
jgi:hypothetical protein